MIGKLSRILKGLSELEALRKQQRYQSTLTQLLLPEVLSFDDPLLKKVTLLLKKDFDLEEPDLSIHKNDVMFHYHLLQVEGKLLSALYSHFAVGARFLKSLRALLLKRNFEPQSILDFGSGYGRVSRLLGHYFPNTKVCVSEVKEEALQFQQKQFGFETLLHTQDSASFKSENYDLILALSVFSHLNLAGFKSWLCALLDHLNPTGILVFSFNKLKSADGATGGFKFVANSEDLLFPQIGDVNRNAEVYGHAYLSHEFIQQAIPGEGFSLEFLGNALTLGQETLLIQKK